MKNLYLLTIAILLPLCGTSVLYAQSPSETSGKFRVGLSGGATYSVQRNTSEELDTLFTPLDWEPGYSAGVVAEYRFHDRFSLVSHILYATYRSSSTSTESIDVVHPSPNPGDLPTIERYVIRHEGDLHYDLWEVDVLGKGKLVRTEEGGFGLALGLSLGHVIAFEGSSIQRLIEPADAKFDISDGYEIRDNGRVRVIAEDLAIPFTSSTRLSAQGGLYCDLALGPAHVTPALGYGYPLTRVFNEDRNPNWIMKAWLFRVDVMMAL